MTSDIFSGVSPVFLTKNSSVLQQVIFSIYIIYSSNQIILSHSETELFLEIEKLCCTFVCYINTISQPIFLTSSFFVTIKVLINKHVWLNFEFFS
jgi:hypothetical protein